MPTKHSEYYTDLKIIRGKKMKVAIIGCGVMGSAFVRALSQDNELFLVSKEVKKASAVSLELGLKQVGIEEGVKHAEVVIIAVKPKDLPSVAEEMSSYVRDEQIILSILAGTSLAKLSSLFPKGQIVRAMPSLPLVCGEGIIGVVDSLSSTAKNIIEHLLSSIALLHFLPESKMDAFTAVCGSSPAFILVILEAMMEGAVSLGFSFADAKELVLKSFEGTIHLLRYSGKHPAELKMDISSPGGTTIAGLGAMEDQGIRAGLIHTLSACCKRSRQMGEEMK